MRRSALLICTCGGTVAEQIAADRLVAVKSPDLVRIASDLCSPEGRRRAAAWLCESAADSLVTAACAFPPVASAVAEVATRAGISPGLVRLVDLRECCAWAHPDPRESAAKAERLVVASLEGIKAPEVTASPAETPVTGRVLVIGGGTAAAAAATRLLRLGCPVTVIRDTGAPGSGSDDESSGGVETIEGRLERLTGQVGRFLAAVRTPGGLETIEAGAVIATGGKGERPLDTASAPESSGRSPAVAFIMPVEPRPDAAEAVLSAAVRLAEEQGGRCLVFFSDIGVAAPGLEELYLKARGVGVTFLRHADGSLEAEREGNGWSIRVDLPGVGLLDESVDALVRVDAPAAPCGGELAGALSISSGDGGWIPGEAMAVAPVGTERPGVFVAGTARAPATSRQAAVQGDAAAVAAALAISSAAAAPHLGAVVDADRCAMCLTCFRTCPHGALEIGTGSAVRVMPWACRGCGICAAACPAGAVQVVESPNGRMLAELDSLARGAAAGGPGQVIAFACANSALQAVQALGRLRRAYSSRIVVVPVPCLGRMEPLHCIRPLVAGARKVLLCGCYDRSCEHLEGPRRARTAAARARDLAVVMGVDPDAVQVWSVAPVDWHRLHQIFEDATGAGPAVGEAAGRGRIHAI